jgi:uncharacterized protein (TIGR02246 family)
MRAAFSVSRIRLGIVAAALCVMCIAPVSAQKKNQPLPPQPTMFNNGPANLVNLPDDKDIDNQISIMLGAWELGDFDKMHTIYADDVLVISGGAQPPISGWANYLTAYKQQRAHMSQVQIQRTNTYTKVSGNTAWVTYQWQFTGTVDGNATAANGHTTLAMEKRDGHWLIVLNHTSIADSAPAAPAPAKSEKP